ncbi:MAG TPA: hypothetical protein VJT82_07385, partial [Pyrinomonadaceae bacterium]|nr:hypothetical protein [Pyrinomonadaceae bacterium]
TRWSDGRREVGVETKALGATNAVKDSLTTTASAATPAPEVAPLKDNASTSSKPTNDSRNAAPERKRSK